MKQFCSGKVAFENALSPRSGCKNAEINQTALCGLNLGGWLVSVRPGEGALWQEKPVSSVLPPWGGREGPARCLLSELHGGGGWVSPLGRLMAAGSLAEGRPQAVSALRLNASEGQNIVPCGHRTRHSLVCTLGILSYEHGPPPPACPPQSPPPSPGWGSLQLRQLGVRGLGWRAAGAESRAHLWL